MTTPTTKIWTIRGPASVQPSIWLPFVLVSDLRGLYHQQTKNLLVSYSPKKLGFF